ncbi:hypothetical protein LF844_10900 [Metapseudomonas lalkuanensis]|uniref:BPSL0761 family protein n=1 Tax=Metapseudomonas lalkuanensis TaxID=2604832 RepID=UPI001CF1A219|nr:BPSL0761 family protein [Pseudomonas lalkuanensis]UCP00286.1 hypothetical protein LF844_10900 [Pseudomonas lalkuanensis]
MNFPNRRTESALQTQDFLIGLTRNADLPDSVRQEVGWLLRHYPNVLHGRMVVAGTPDTPALREGSVHSGQ